MIACDTNKKVLVLAPHPDDGEFGCGGTVAKYVEKGYQVHYVTFSLCRESIPNNLPPDILKNELQEAAKSLGVVDCKIFDYEVRRFTYKRQEIMEDIYALKKSIDPAIIFTPSSSDIHQDHEVIHNESKRAFKHNNLLGYELPWNNMVMSTTFFSKLTEAHVSRKAKAILEYKSQLHRYYYNEEFVRSLAFARGTQVGARYAEAFEVIRIVD